MKKNNARDDKTIDMFHDSIGNIGAVIDQGAPVGVESQNSVDLNLDSFSNCEEALDHLISEFADEILRADLYYVGANPEGDVSVLALDEDDPSLTAKLEKFRSEFSSATVVVKNAELVEKKIDTLKDRMKKAAGIDGPDQGDLESDINQAMSDESNHFEFDEDAATISRNRFGM